MAKWINLGPWRKLQGLPQAFAAQAGKPLHVAGAALEAALRSEDIPTRIQPSCVKRVDPIFVANRVPAAGRRVPPNSSSNPLSAPTPHVPGTTCDPTVQGNGGWDMVDWESGSIDQCEIEVHWPSFQTWMKERQPDGPDSQSKRDASDNEVLEAVRSVYRKADSAPNLADVWPLVRNELALINAKATKERVQRAAELDEFKRLRKKPGEHRSRG